MRTDSSLGQRPIAVWALASALATTVLIRGGVLGSYPQHMSWTWLGFALVAWSAAGAMTFDRARASRGFAIWAAAFAVGVAVAALVNTRMDQSTFFQTSTVRVFAFVLGCGSAAIVGGLASAMTQDGPRQLGDAMRFALAWGACFLVGACVAMALVNTVGSFTARSMGIKAAEWPLVYRCLLYSVWAASGAAGGALAAYGGFDARLALSQQPMRVPRPAAVAR